LMTRCGARHCINKNGNKKRNRKRQGQMQGGSGTTRKHMVHCHDR
jgi:hypothetical protein